jgi:hypothetical protein
MLVDISAKGHFGKFCPKAKGAGGLSPGFQTLGTATQSGAPLIGGRSNVLTTRTQNLIVARLNCAYSLTLGTLKINEVPPG